ncbi:MAG: hypothetical protein GY778_08005 [bacterium]|nr:hypothetical protein [bacterium]
MFRTMLTVACAVLVVGWAVPAMAGDCPGCKKIEKQGEGFCGHCDQGKIFGVELASQKLYDAVAGEKVDAEKMKCDGCKKAAKKNDTCCGKSYAAGKAFKSPVGYKLAMGKPYTAKKAAHCPGCKNAFESNGFCTGCNEGFVASRAFKSKENYDAALAAHKTLAKAAKTSKKCEACAVAMVTDGACKHCNVSYKDGSVVQ